MLRLRIFVGVQAFLLISQADYNIGPIQQCQRSTGRQKKKKLSFLVSGNSCNTKRGYYLRLRRLMFYFGKRGTLMLAINRISLKNRWASLQSSSSRISFRPHICHGFHGLYLWGKSCIVEKFQISVKNLNNLWRFIEILYRFGSKFVWRKYRWRKNDKYEVCIWLYSTQRI